MVMHSSLEYIYADMHCPICGREFVVPDRERWVYKTGSFGTAKYYCRWSCLQKARKDEETKKKRKDDEYESAGDSWKFD